MKKLPIGIQTFEMLITSGYAYVDKTAYVEQLVSEGEYFFLSRPRRFGKSLFLSTLKAAFEGKKDLFEGLALHSCWDWGVNHPVIHISFGAGVMRSVQELYDTQDEILARSCRANGISELVSPTPKGRLFELIEQAYEKYGQPVVVLLDEYDKPILDNINNTDMAVAMREELRNFYSVLKDADSFLRFVFITGVSKFSKVSLFSGLNHLEDITGRP